MARDNTTQGKQRRRAHIWVITVFFATIVISFFMNWLSDAFLSGGGLIPAFLALFVIVAIGIVFDAIGVAVTSADERPFHSMAARKVKGAKEAINLLRNAGPVSSVCNDVIGDICGVVSGVASATIAARVLSHFQFSRPQIAALLLSSLVAGLTVGGKAAGKTVALHNCTEIVHAVGKFIAFWNGLFHADTKK